MTGSISRSLVLVLVVFCGCSLLVKPAEVELVGLAFPSENFMDLAVVVRNRNAFSARASDMEYRITIGGEEVGRGHTHETLSIRGGGSLKTHFPVRYDPAALVRVLPQITQDTVVVRVDGTYRLRSLVLMPQLQFSAERRIAVKEKLGGILKSLFGDEPGKAK